MTLPPPEEIHRMSQRGLLVLGLRWYEAEGDFAFRALTGAMVIYGPDAVDPVLRYRASSAFAMATLLTGAVATSQNHGARSNELAIAAALTSMLRSAFAAIAPVQRGVA